MARGTKQLITYGALAVLVVLSGGLAYGAVAGSDSPARSNTRTVTVATGSISQTVSATGNLQPAGLVSIGFATSGTITEIDVAAGEQVTAGEVLAKLDPTQAQTALDVANLNLAAAQTKLTQARAGTSGNGPSASGGSSGVSQAQLNADGVALSDAQNAASVNAQGYQLDVDQAQAQLDKDQKQLADDQAACESSTSTTGSSTESSAAACDTTADQDAVDKDQNALDSAKQKQAQGLQHDQQAVHTAQAKLDTDEASASGAQPTVSATTIDQAAIDSAQAGVIQAQAAVDSAQKALDATTLVAPSAGTISTVATAVGAQVSAGSTGSSTSSASAGGGGGGAAAASGTTSNAASSTSAAAFTIVDPTAFEVKVAFPESDAVKVKVGQAATASLDALTGTSLAGTVTSIDSTATVTSNVVTYNAIVSVTGAPSTARAGMTANVSVTTVSKDNVVEVATAAVQTQAGTSYVDKLVNGQIQQTDVTTGIQGDSSTEILSGLQAGDQVVISTGTVSTAATNGRTGGGTGTLGGGGFQGGGGGGGFPGGGAN